MKKFHITESKGELTFSIMNDFHHKKKSLPPKDFFIKKLCPFLSNHELIISEKIFFLQETGLGTNTFETQTVVFGIIFFRKSIKMLETLKLKEIKIKTAVLIFKVILNKKGPISSEKNVCAK